MHHTYWLPATVYFYYCGCHVPCRVQINKTLKKNKQINKNLKTDALIVQNYDTYICGQTILCNTTQASLIVP